jgi:AraC-type DNA-binding domain-containing proteins
MKPLMEVRKDNSEIVRYNFEDYAAFAGRMNLSRFPDYAVNNHWHDDLEFIVVLSGHMLYNINGSVVQINPEQGIIVNSLRLHYGFSADNVECDFICILLHPTLLSSSQYFESNFVTPFLSDDAPPYLLLTGEKSWENDVITAVKDIYNCRNQSSAPLRIHTLFSQIWLTLYDNVFQHKNIPYSSNKDELIPPLFCEHLSLPPGKRDQKLTPLKNMILFIKKNYQEKITLEDIAKVGYLSKSGCLSLFKRYLNETPVNFLINYRIKVGADLLCSTNKPVTEIAYMVGFSNASYFTESFHKFCGCTPLEYRAERSENQEENG